MINDPPTLSLLDQLSSCVLVTKKRPIRVSVARHVSVIDTL